MAPRTAAVEILCLWATTHNPVDHLYQTTAPRLAEIDRGLVKTLVYGVLRHKQYLDHIIRRFSRHPLRKMKVRTLMTLRLGVFQLLLLSRIPESAAVNATVNTLKAAGQPGWLVGFVNGLLRAVVRERTTLPTPEALAAAEPPLLNHPDWLVQRWQACFGDPLTREICRRNNTEPPLTLRTNTRRTGRALLRARFEQSGIVVENGRYSPAALVVPAFPGAVAALPGYAEGQFQVQDEAAQLASLLIPPPAGPLPGARRLCRSGRQNLPPGRTAAGRRHARRGRTRPAALRPAAREPRPSRSGRVGRRPAHRPRPVRRHPARAVRRHPH